MYQPEQYGVVLLFMLVTMICWGSWANTVKLTPGWPFQLFYWDYIFGLIAASLFWGVTLGSVHGGATAFFLDLAQADMTHVAYAIAGGVVFNLANLLLVAAIEIAGLAVAFPLGIGVALVVGVVLNYILSPKGNPYFLACGVVLVAIAILLDAYAYRSRETRSKSVSARGIRISLLCGVLMGVFYPLVTKATAGHASLGPYAVVFWFSIGTLICSLPANWYLMRKPLTDTPSVGFGDYLRGRANFHVWGLIGGVIWCTGMVLNIVASRAQIVGPAVSYAIGQGATMVSAIWGVFIWREFSNAPLKSKQLIGGMFFFFIAGLSLIALAPVIGHR
jgi:glucose uptake protein